METAESSAKVSKFLAQGSDVNGERKEASALRCSQEKWEPRLTPRASIFWVPRKCKTEDLHRQKSGDGKVCAEKQEPSPLARCARGRLALRPSS